MITYPVSLPPTMQPEAHILFNVNNQQNLRRVGKWIGTTFGVRPGGTGKVTGWQTHKRIHEEKAPIIDCGNVALKLAIDYVPVQCLWNVLFVARS